MAASSRRRSARRVHETRKGSLVESVRSHINLETMYEAVCEAMRAHTWHELPASVSAAQYKALRYLIHPLITRCSMEAAADVRLASNALHSVAACLGFDDRQHGVKKIGNGAFGTVYRVAVSALPLAQRRALFGSARSLPEYVAVKIDALDSMDWLKSYKSESILQVLRASTRIARRAGELHVGPVVYGAFPCVQGKQGLFVTVMQFLPYPTWEEWASHATLAQRHAALAMLRAKHALMSAHLVVHNDLHDNNVLVAADGRGNATDVAIIDYGLALTFAEVARSDLKTIDLELKDDPVKHVVAHLLASGAIRL